MSDLIVIGFDKPEQADLAMAKVQEMGSEGLIDVDSTCVVVRDRDGRVSYRSTNRLPLPSAGTGAALGGFWGLLLGALLAPFSVGASAAAAVVAAGTALGAASGAAAGGLDRTDFDDAFTSEMETLLRPGTSALLVLVGGYHTLDTDDLLRRLQPLHGIVLRTNLAARAEAMLQRALL